jgi:hypothetical protein
VNLAYKSGSALQILLESARCNPPVFHGSLASTPFLSRLILRYNEFQSAGLAYSVPTLVSDGNLKDFGFLGQLFLAVYSIPESLTLQPSIPDYWKEHIQSHPPESHPDVPVIFFSFVDQLLVDNPIAKESGGEIDDLFRVFESLGPFISYPVYKLANPQFATDWVQPLADVGRVWFRVMEKLPLNRFVFEFAITLLKSTLNFWSLLNSSAFSYLTRYFVSCGNEIGSLERFYDVVLPFLVINNDDILNSPRPVDRFPTAAVYRSLIEFFEEFVKVCGDDLQVKFQRLISACWNARFCGEWCDRLMEFVRSRAYEWALLEIASKSVVKNTTNPAYCAFFDVVVEAHRIKCVFDGDYLAPVESDWADV